MENEESKQTIDWTPFWIGWRVACSIDICKNPSQFRRACLDRVQPGCHSEDLSNLAKRAEEIAELARKANADYSEFASKLLESYQEKSDVLANDFSENGQGFQELENWLYKKGEIKGKPFKVYLFQDAATRSGGMSKNLHGSLKKILARHILQNTLFKESKRNKGINGKGLRIISMPQTVDENGNVSDQEFSSPENIANSWLLSAETHVQTEEIEKWFSEFLGKKTDEWKGKDVYWIALYVLFFGMVLSNVHVLQLAGVEKSRFSQIAGTIKQELKAEMTSRFSVDGVQYALRGRNLHQMLAQTLKNKEWFESLKSIQAKE